MVFYGRVTKNPVYVEIIRYRSKNLNTYVCIFQGLESVSIRLLMQPV